MQKLVKYFETKNDGKKPSLLTWCCLFIFVDSETLKLDHFDEAGYTFIAPRSVNFPVTSIISAVNRHLLRLMTFTKYRPDQ